MEWDLSDVAAIILALTSFVAACGAIYKNWTTARQAAKKTTVAEQKTALDSLKEEVARLCQRVENLTAQNEHLEELNGQLTRMNTELAGKVEVQREQIEQLTRDLRDTMGERDQLRRRVGELETALKSLQMKLPGLDHAASA